MIDHFHILLFAFANCLFYTNILEFPYMSKQQIPLSRTVYSIIRQLGNIPRDDFGLAELFSKLNKYSGKIAR